MKLGRNDPCWCKSHRKYKNCHLVFDQRLQEHEANGVLVPRPEMIKNMEQIAGIEKAGLLNTKILDMAEEYIRPGISTEEINTFVHQHTINLGGIPAPLGFEGYPKSVCTSINHEVCHGIPDKDRFLQDGDIINVDVTTIVNGYYADASRMILIGTVSDERQKLVTIAKECLELGLAAANPWGYLGDIGAAIHQHATKHGYSIVKQIGGHGVGVDFHEEPWVSHIGIPGTGMLLVPGMIFTIEPMVNAGTPEVYQDNTNGWTIYTEDHLDSAQWEYTVLITETGNKILTH